jgi:hypothetical protein
VSIHAYADNDEDNVEDANEPARDDAAKTWILPPSTPGCEITIHNGGWIYTLTGSKGSFGGNARIEAGRDHARRADVPGPLGADADHVEVQQGARDRVRSGP